MESPRKVIYRGRPPTLSAALKQRLSSERTCWRTGLAQINPLAPGLRRMPGYAKIGMSMYIPLPTLQWLYGGSDKFW